MATESPGRALSRRKTSPTSGEREKTRDAAAIRVVSSRELRTPSSTHPHSHRPGLASLNMFRLPPLSSMARFSNPTPDRRALFMFRQGPTIRAWCQTRDIRPHTQTCNRLVRRLVPPSKPDPLTLMLVPTAACPAALPIRFQRKHGHVRTCAVCCWAPGQLATPGFQPSPHLVPAPC